jgi:hypothetical protein
MAGSTVVLKVEYDFNSGECMVEVMGHPTDALQKAHALTSDIMDMSEPWSIIHMEFQQAPIDADDQAVLKVWSLVKSKIGAPKDEVGHWMSLERFAEMMDLDDTTVLVWLDGHNIPYNAESKAILKTVAVRHIDPIFRQALQAEIVKEG